ncbi:MAG: hypothetical protein OXG92_15430 [Chloroflexi bacterium]|nr:hypothetical protein [Chloroflexota bacterium]MCY3582118.1 hypothetical protein [Chloroflexota bacterium]MCY3717841.1 hypothetical protein [Chloroflexota bacterium]MDE2649812.1 hypothetical protein [Chloroflexota bacterium]MXX51476.1 glycoside hydrolase family 5 protein [Chloroflexota bacterium]
MRRLIVLLFFLAIVLLGLDMHFRGLAWGFIWSQTGEEAPLPQARGLVEVAGNLLRHPLDTAPLAAIDHKADVPYGVNTFLQLEVEADKIDAMLRMIHAAGFRWLRQEFPWEDIETDGRGQFTDSRLDRDGDGARDTIDAWLKYDQIVDLSERHGLRLLVRLSNPPRWSRADPEELDLAPPDDLQDFVNFAAAVASRYRGRVSHYQIWNEPNIYPEWGDNPVDPAGYAQMLCRTYAALKAIDPTIVVVSGAIAQTIALDGYWGMSDLVYLQALYDHGAGACFDVLSAQGYGLRSGPTDQRLRATSVNVARHSYYRDIMVRNGDAHKPIWLSEVAWNATLDADLPPEQIVGYANFGNVTQAQAARYMPLFYERAQQDWAWVGNTMYWFFTRPDPFEAGQAFYYFRMVEPDYQPEKPTFTPLPIYESVADYINNQQPTLYRGRHQAETWQIAADGEALADESARFGRAQMFAEGIAFRAHGTSLTIRWREADDSGWRVSRVPISAGLAGTQSIHFGEGSLVVDEIVVFDRGGSRLLAWLALGFALGLVALAWLVAALRGRAR